MNMPTIVCLCGSTKFRDTFNTANFRETMKGNIVLQPGVWVHSPGWSTTTIAEKKRLDDLHLSKIDLADEIFVVNPNNYIGESTDREIQYAYARSKTVRFLDPVGEERYSA